MSLVRPNACRATMMVLLVAAVVLGWASAANAHAGAGGQSSDYRIRIDGWTGDPQGIELRVIELGDRLELRRTTAAAVFVLGYSGEPYLRLDERGVAGNASSPAYYLNGDRFASSDPPASANANAVPTWQAMDSGNMVRWHDHRAHWMSPTPRADVLADPSVERVILDRSPVELLVDGRAVTALISVTWLPPPQRWVWLATSGGIALGLAAVIVLVPRAKRLVPLLAVIAAAGALLSQGQSPVRVVLTAGALIGAVAAAALRSHLLAVAAASVAGLVVLTRMEPFEHELLAGWVGGYSQRVALAAAIACSVAVVAAAIVGALEPTAAGRPAADGGGG